MDADVHTAFESEYHLCQETEDGLVPLDDRGVYATECMRTAHPITTDIVGALKDQNIGFEKYYPEHAPGKHEVVIAPSSGVTAADEHLFLKETVKGVAANHDLQATFLPRPFPGSTNGCHIHLSLWNRDENEFYDAGDADGLSDRARYFIGGVLAHADALVALTAPTVNSYARLRPQTEASAFACWGLDNREAAVRIPSPKGDAEKTTRLEFRPADNAANPYLALLGILAAGMDGVERELDPGNPVGFDPGNLPRVERDDRDICRLPETLGEAIRALEADDVLADALGPDLHKSYIEVKRTQWQSFTESAGEWNLERFRQVF
nr:glutamine synthetase [Haloprofundus halobius]